MTPSRWPVVLGVLVGSGLATVGVVSALEESKPVLLAGWVVGLAVAHDLVVAPVVLGVGRLVRRWPSVAVGLLLSGVVVLFAFPFVRGYGRRADDPSALPRDYRAGLLVVLAVIWAAVALRALVNGLLSRSCPPRPMCRRARWTDDRSSS